MKKFKITTCSTLYGLDEIFLTAEDEKAAKELAVRKVGKLRYQPASPVHSNNHWRGGPCLSRVDVAEVVELSKKSEVPSS